MQLPRIKLDHDPVDCDDDFDNSDNHVDDNNADLNNSDNHVDKYIMIQCLSVTFLFLPALLLSPVQSCYDWIKHNIIWQKNVWVTSRFFNHGGQLGPRVGHVT